MKPFLTASLSLAIPLAAGLAASAASASGPLSCSVPRSERQPSVKLQRDLKAAGWKIRKIEVENGCYEVYGSDPEGKAVKAFFDPRTLERLQGTG